MLGKTPFRTALALALTLTFGGCPDSGPTTTQPPPATGAPPVSATPLVPTRQVADWCAEHVVPESICTRCNESLVAGFKAKGDWCQQHGLPDSQCVTCHPELEAKFRAMAPAR